MASLKTVAAEALPKIVHKLKELWIAASRRCNIADESRAEQGIPLDVMDTGGMRNRLGSGPVGTASNDPDSPTTTTSGESGTLTPGSDNILDNQEDTIVKTLWRRLSEVFGTGFLSRISSEERERVEQEYGYHNFVREKIDAYPDGFSRLAAVVASDEDYSMGRGFKYLYARVLLQLQVELTELEKALFALDKKYDSKPAMQYRKRSTKQKEGGDNEHGELLNEIKAKLKEYTHHTRDLVFLQSQGPPPERNHRSYFNWIWRKQPLGRGHDDYIYHASDFVTTSGTKPTYFEELVRGHIENWRGSPIRAWLKIKEQTSSPAPDSGVNFYSASRLGRIGQVLLVSTIMGVLQIPVFLLFLVHMSRVMMAMTTFGFIFLFANIMTVVAEGRTYEIFVGTATYAAILVMFLGNISQVSTGSGPN